MTVIAITKYDVCPTCGNKPQNGEQITVCQEIRTTLSSDVLSVKQTFGRDGCEKFPKKITFVMSNGMEICYKRVRAAKVENKERER